MTKSRLAVYALCAIAGVFALDTAVKHLQRSGSLNGHTIPAKEGPSAVIRSLRPVYPYSVIAGGIYSPQELAAANSKDAVVRAHYSDFNVNRAKLVQLTDDRYQYASYRVKDQIYWTRKKLRIPKGELLWSDGTSYARARCGNRLSDQPHDPTAPAEPAEALLSLPPFRPEMRAKLDLTDPPPLDGGSAGDPAPNDKGAAPAAAPIAAPVGPVWGPGPAVFPVSPIITSSGGAPAVSGGTSSAGGSPSAAPTPVTPLTPAPPPTVSPVPEPGSAFYLFFLALAASLWAIWKFTPKEQPDSDDGEGK